MIKNYIKLALLGIVLSTGVAKSATLTTVVASGSMTNLLQGFQNSALVSQVVITAPTTTNASVLLVDTYTNALTYTNPAYTYRAFYLTNYVYQYTNYYGVNTQYTNGPTEVDITNTVASTTNSYPIRLGAAATAGASASYVALDAYFVHGIWATNTGPSNAVVTITYK